LQFKCNGTRGHQRLGQAELDDLKKFKEEQRKIEEQEKIKGRRRKFDYENLK
jgi:hypothetical protein